MCVCVSMTHNTLYLIILKIDGLQIQVNQSGVKNEALVDVEHQRMHPLLLDMHSVSDI